MSKQPDKPATTKPATREEILRELIGSLKFFILNKGNPVAGNQRFYRGYRINPHYALAYKNRGATYLRTGDRAKANADLATARRLNEFKEAEAGFRSLTEAIDTTTAPGRMMMQMVGAFAEFERAILRERTKAGLDAARKQGRSEGDGQNSDPINRMKS